MAQQTSINIPTHGRHTYEITQAIERFVASSTISNGLCNIFCQHTSASLIISENADPDVQRDLDVFMAGLVHDGDPRFIHTMEGDDDMPAHIRSVLTATSLSVPIINHQLGLGTWQGIFLWEHRYASQNRHLTLTLID
ncbi:MAG: secondary thiamine-phosphate synthase [Piscirickettsiaceae bacterium]|nr:MAG: secondary thiamine-phosphate synthase [Piscirickettsiaceae bacterium]